MSDVGDVDLRLSAAGRRGAARANASGCFALLVLLSSFGCAPSGLGPVTRYPFVEDRDLRLVHETLRLRVEPLSVEVDALFRFAGKGAKEARVMTFPVGSGAKPDRFHAAVGAERPVAIPVARGEAGALPMGRAGESWDLFFAAAELARHDGVLRVRYEQPAEREFAYVLKSGAYWDGPIRDLVVVVEDPHGRIAELEVEGRAYALGGERYLELEMLDIEPRSGVKMVLR